MLKVSVYGPSLCPLGGSSGLVREECMNNSRRAAAYLFVLASISLIGAWSAQAAWEFDVDEAGRPVMGGVVTLASLDLTYSSQMGYDVVTVQDGGVSHEPGMPMLPTLQVRVAIPCGYDARAVHLVRTDTRSLSGRYDLFPVQPAVPISQVGPSQWVPQNPAAYASATAYPETPVRLLGQTDYAGQAMAVVEITPLAYVAAAQTLQRHAAIEFVVELAEGGVRGDLLPAQASPAEQARIEDLLRGQVVNPERVRATPLASPLLPPELILQRNLDPADYDYVIISPVGFETVYEELADWKTRRGVRTTVVSIDWIYNGGGYSGSDLEKIRAFIIDAHGQWGATSFLLGGDTNKIPCHWRMLQDNIPNDTYFADYDDDWTVEVNVGRVPARYASYAYTFVQKILNYEKNPPMNDFGKRAIFLGFDLDASTPGEEVKNAILDLYMPEEWTVLTEYDSEPGTHKDDSIALIQDGFNLLNHIDHSNTTWMGVGSTWHDQSLGIGDVNAFINGSRNGTVYSVGCYACNYENYQCIAEAWVQNANGGALAFVGNSRYGWYNPGLLNTLSNRYDRLFFRSIFQQGHIDLGAAFSDHKNDQYPGGDPTYQYVWTELTLLGDPEMRLWMDDPALIAVTHEATIMAGRDECTVQVEYQGGGGVAGATVCLWKVDEDLHLVETTGATGSATFSVQPALEGEIYVTVSGSDVVPYEGTILVLGTSTVEDQDAGPTLALRTGRSLTAGAAELLFELPGAGRVSLSVYDLSGRRVRTLIGGEAYGAGRHPVLWDGRDDAGRPVGSGVYLYRLAVDGQSKQARGIVLR
jgi:hypothetical protein